MGTHLLHATFDCDVLPLQATLRLSLRAVQRERNGAIGFRVGPDVCRGMSKGLHRERKWFSPSSEGSFSRGLVSPEASPSPAWLSPANVFAECPSLSAMWAAR